MDTGTKDTALGRERSLDDRERSFDGDVLKGDIKVGAVSGHAAREATAREHQMTFLEAVKTYPTAIGWSM